MIAAVVPVTVASSAVGLRAVASGNVTVHY
jgi:hypothetical protein